jgi:hypothetical protein
MGSIADDREHPAPSARVFTEALPAVYRKRLLLGFAFTGATAATLFLLLSSSSALWAGAGLLAIVANVCFGASIVALNAYLPLLARESDEAASARTALLAAGGSVDPARTSLDELAAPLLREASDTHGEAAVEPIVGDAAAAYATAVSAATARISSQGIALGYSAGIALLLLALIPVTLMKGSTLSLRLAIGASGLWWALGTLPAAGWLPVGTEATDEPGEADEWSARPAGRVVSARKHVLRDVGRAWARLVATLHPKEVAQLRNTFKYLAAWFLLSDGPVYVPRRTRPLLTCTCRLHNDHVDRDSVREDRTGHVALGAHTRRRAHAERGDCGRAGVAARAARARLVEPPRAHDAGRACEPHPRVRLPRLPPAVPQRGREVRWAHDPGRDVRARHLLWYVILLLMQRNLN